VETKSQETQDLNVIQDLVVARITKLMLTETKKESQDHLVSQKRHVRGKKVKLKDIPDPPVNKDNPVVARKATMRDTPDPLVSLDNPVEARKATMRVTPDPLVILDNILEVDRMVKLTRHTLNPKDPQESTKMEKSEAMTEVPTDVPEDPVVRVAEVAVAKVVRDPMVNSVAEEETATVVVDLVPKAIVPGPSPATTAKKKDTSPETAPTHHPLLSEINDSVY